MIKKPIVLTLCVLAFVLITCPAWGLDLKPGSYEITTKVEMPGMPQMPPQTFTQCITEQDPVPVKSAQGQQCEVKNMKTDGNTVTWTMICSQEGMESTSTGKMVYEGDSFEGSMKTVMGSAAGNMTITSEVSGKRVGDCE